MVKNAQYHCWESIDINPVPASISDEVLESNICKALSLTGHEVKPNKKKKDTVIAIFICRKQKRSILINRKNLRNKSDVLTQLISLLGSLLGRACVTRTISYLINVES